MRVFHWPAMFSPFVEDALEAVDSAIRMKHPQAVRATDPSLAGRMTIAVVPDIALEGVGDPDHNARIVALLARTDIAVFTSRHRNVHSVTVGSHEPLTGKTLLGCLEAILMMEDGNVATLDLDGREAGDHLNVMGAGR